MWPNLSINIPSAEEMGNSSLVSLAQLSDVVKRSFPSLEAVLLPQGGKSTVEESWLIKI